MVAKKHIKQNKLNQAVGLLSLIIVFIILAFAFNLNKIQGYSVKNNFESDVDLLLDISPGEGPAGSSFIGTFYIENKRNPLFNYSIKMLAPCEPNFDEISKWGSNTKFTDRIKFSGVIDRSKRIGYYFGIPFLYDQCLYSWNIPDPRSKNSKALPLLKPREMLRIEFLLQSNRNAHPGIYFVEYIDQYNFAGKSVIRFTK